MFIELTVVGFSTNQPLTADQKRQLWEKALGRPHSLEAKQKMCLAHKGKKRRPLSLSHRQNIRLGFVGNPRNQPSEETRQKMQEAARKSSHIQTGETKQKISQKMKQLWKNRQTQEQLLTCPHCHQVGRGPGMLIWHFDKCQKNESNSRPLQNLTFVRAASTRVHKKVFFGPIFS